METLQACSPVRVSTHSSVPIAFAQAVPLPLYLTGTAVVSACIAQNLPTYWNPHHATILRMHMPPCGVFTPLSFSWPPCTLA